jgi:hypothetical protein
MELEPGPFTLIEGPIFVARVSDDTFEQLLGASLLALGDVDGVLQSAHTLIAEGASPAEAEHEFNSAIGDVERALADVGFELDALRPADLVEQTAAQLPTVDQAENEYRDAAAEAPPQEALFPPGEAPGGPDLPGPTPEN